VVSSAPGHTEVPTESIDSNRHHSRPGVHLDGTDHSGDRLPIAVPDGDRGTDLERIAGKVPGDEHPWTAGQHIDALGHQARSGCVAHFVPPQLAIFVPTLLRLVQIVVQAWKRGLD
jgi:hypothetical protein